MERKWWTLIVVCVGMFMLLLDITIVNVALPRIATELRASFSDIQWVIDAYTLSLASLLLTAGTLADLVGRRLLFAVGLVLFSLTSLLCALAPSALFLILARGGQGIGGAIMFSTSLALLAQEFQGRERASAFAAWGATVGASTAVGPLLGGVLTQQLGWSSIFYINVPVGIAAAALTLAKVAESRNPAVPGRRIDWLGTVTFSAGLLLLVLALIRGNSEGWGSALIVALLAGSAVLLIAFVLAELAQEHPMLDLSLLRRPTFAGVSLVAFGLSASMFAMFLYLTVYLQAILGYSPLQTGLRFLPITVVSFLVAALSGRLTARLSARLRLAGGLGLVGVALMTMRGLGPSSHWTALLPGFLLGGAGIGLANPAIAATAVGVVSPARSGMASGINSTFRQAGMATGIAALGAIFERKITSGLARALVGTSLAGHAGQLAHAVAGGAPLRILATVPGAAQARAVYAIPGAFAGAMKEILLIAAITALAAATLAALLVRDSELAGQRTAQPVPAPVADAAR